MGTSVSTFFSFKTLWLEQVWRTWRDWNHHLKSRLGATAGAAELLSCNKANFDKCEFFRCFVKVLKTEQHLSATLSVALLRKDMAVFPKPLSQVTSSVSTKHHDKFVFTAGMTERKVLLKGR